MLNQLSNCHMPYKTGQSLSMQVMGFIDRVAANNFMVLNPNKVSAAVHLDVTLAEAVGFTLQTNSTVSSSA